MEGILNGEGEEKKAQTLSLSHELLINYVQQVLQWRLRACSPGGGGGPEGAVPHSTQRKVGNSDSPSEIQELSAATQGSAR